MSTSGGKITVSAMQDGCNSVGRAFSARFSPDTVSDGKWLWLFNRKEVERRIRLLSVWEIISRVSMKLPEVADIAKEVMEMPKEKRTVFFFQPKIAFGKERFVLVLAKPGYDKKLFDDIALLVSSSKAFWKVAQNDDIVVLLGCDGKDEIFVGGRRHKYGLLQRWILEYADLDDELLYLKTNGKSPFFFDTIPAGEPGKNPSMVLFSDNHLADKTAIDNFGSEKEKSLVSMLNGFCGGVQPAVVVGGDLFDMWQTTYGNIQKAYSGKGSVLEALAKIERLFLISGNHDEDLLKSEKAREWILKLLPNASVTPCLMVTSSGFDAIVYHGDKQDPTNNNTVFGKTMSRIVAVIERVFSFFVQQDQDALSFEQTLMGILRSSLAPTSVLVESDIMKHLASFIADINAYIYWNHMSLAYIEPGEKRDFLIFLGHTHRMIRHDQNSPIQMALRLLIDEFVASTPAENMANKSYLINRVNVVHINLGAGSGAGLESEYLENRNRWESVDKEMKILGKSGLGYKDYVERKRGSPKGSQRQNSVRIYDMDGDGVAVSYTKDDYCSESEPEAI